MGLWRFQWRFQRQYLCHGLLCANLFCFTFLIQPSAVFGQAEFSDTHSGIDEDDDDLGLSVNEAETLDADMQRMFNRFKDGRKQTSQGGNGRWSQGLEFHDSDFDGRTDHPGSYAGLESRVEETVVGQKGLSGQAWVDAHEEQKGSIGNCADGQGPDNSKCHNISSVIEDMGDAHGRSNQIGGGSDHRVYKVRDDVAQKVEEAGHEYANAVFRDAKPVNAEEAVGRFSDSGDGAQTSFSNGQLVTRFRDGRVVRSDFKENIDLLRSEAMWSVKQIEGVWKYHFSRRKRCRNSAASFRRSW